MKSRVLAILAISILVHSVAMAQVEREFTDKVANYKIGLVDDWQAESYTDAFGRQKTEFVFHSRREGLLRIAKESPVGLSVSEKVHNDLNDMRLRNACLFSSEAAFLGGQLSGIRLAIYFLQDGRHVVGTYYFLEDANCVWVLRFTAEPGSRGIAREITDKMARSFCSVCPFQWSRSRAAQGTSEQ